MGIKFSIITVCYNSISTIEETIESVRKQTYDEYEHIIIDGSSTDGTKDIIEKYAKSSNKVKFISENDKGIYNAMNKGIKLATGDFIVFLNSDDTFEKNSLQIINENYNDFVEIIYGDVYWQEEFNGVRYEKKLDLRPDEYSISSRDDYDIFSKKYLGKIMSAHNASFIRADLMKNNLFDENLKICSDYKFFLNMHLQNRKIKYVPYRITNMKMGGISTTQLELGLEEHIKCELDTLGYTTLNKEKRQREIRIMNIIKKISLLILPKNYYVKLRYLNKGWYK